MPTILQERVLKIKLAQVSKQHPMTSGEILREAGYSDKFSKQPCRVFESKGFQALLAKYDDAPVLDAIYQDCFAKDKRVSFSNRKLYLDIKGYTKGTSASDDYDMLKKLQE